MFASRKKIRWVLDFSRPIDHGDEQKRKGQSGLNKKTLDNGGETKAKAIENKKKKFSIKNGIELGKKKKKEKSGNTKPQIKQP